MTDFFKAVILDIDIEALKNHNKLHFIGSHSCKTGEILPKVSAEYQNMKFMICNSGTVILQGSLHKYKNGGLHNYDDFSYQDMCYVLKELSMIFNFKLDKCVIRNLEIGINISHFEDTQKILDNLLHHRGVRFKDISNTNGYIKHLERQQYIFKIYDKGLQYKLPYENLRVELKYKRMSKVNQLGVYSLNDLLDKDLFFLLTEQVLKEWQLLVMYEEPKTRSNLPSLIKNKKQHQWRSILYWKNLGKQERSRQRKSYTRYVETYTHNRHSELESIMREKFKLLMQNVDPLTIQI